MSKHTVQISKDGAIYEKVFLLPRKLRESTCENCAGRDKWYGRVLGKKHAAIIELSNEVKVLYKVIRKLYKLPLDVIVKEVEREKKLG